MRTCHFLVLVAAAALGCGTGAADPRQPVEPTLDYALFVRAEVDRLKVAEAGLQSAIDSFVENMEGYESRAVGTNKATYDAIYKAAQELKGLKDRGARDHQLRERIDGIVSLAQQLPAESTQPP
ncbi:MAG: hypothetical protein L0211_19395 [Planctomycetaceae bacterium]|nr:hypothetical protein [Planctomycetaceae bacterium]